MDMNRYAAEFLNEFGPKPLDAPLSIAVAALQGDKDVVILALTDLLRKAVETKKRAEQSEIALFMLQARVDELTKENADLKDIVVNGLQRLR